MTKQRKGKTVIKQFDDCSKLWIKAFIRICLLAALSMKEIAELEIRITTN